MQMMSVPKKRETNLLFLIIFEFSSKCLNGKLNVMEIESINLTLDYGLMPGTQACLSITSTAKFLRAAQDKRFKLEFSLNLP